MKLIAAAAGVMMSLIAGAGIASAQPDMEVIVNSSCTYPQVMAALEAQSPEVSQQLSANPAATAWLRQLIASPPDQRRQMVEQARRMPAIQQYSPLIMQVANTCNNF